MGKTITVWRGRPISDLTLEEARQALDDAAAQIAHANTMAENDRAMILALSGEHDASRCLTTIHWAFDRASTAEARVGRLQEILYRISAMDGPTAEQSAAETARKALEVNA